MNNERSPAEVRLTDGLGPLPDAAMRMVSDENGVSVYPDFYTADQMREYAAQEAAAKLRQLRAALDEIDRYSVNTLRTNSKDRGDWAEDVAYIGKLARDALRAQRSS